MAGRYRNWQRINNNFRAYVGDAADTRGFISIETYVDQAMAVFDGLEVNSTQIQKRLMRTVGSGASGYLKRNFNKVLHSRTGTLKRSITYRMGRNGDYVVITNTATADKSAARLGYRMGEGSGSGRKARYGFMLAHGYVVKAKTSKGLTFNINGKWVRKHSVIVQPKDWVEPPVERYTDSSELQTRLDKELQRQVDYWERRLTKA